MTLVAALVAVALLPLLRPILQLLGAKDRTLDAALIFLLIAMPTNPLMALGMGLSGVLRATGDARLVLRARLLSPKAGSGAAYFLTGKAGSALAASIIDGSVAADTEVTAEVVAVGVDIARRVMVERDCLDGGSHSERPFR